MTSVTTARNDGHRQPTDVPLPALAVFPDLPHEHIDTEWERSSRALARARGRVRERNQWRDAIAKFKDERPPYVEPSEVTVTFRLDSRGVHALVVMCAGRVGSRRILRRFGGPLRVDQRAVRGMGPSVALLRLLRALEQDLDQ